MSDTKTGADAITVRNVVVRTQGAARLFMYLLLGGLLAAVEALLVVLTHRFASLSDDNTARLVTYIAIALGAMLFLPIYARLRWALDTVVYHDTYELGAMLQHFSQELGALSDHERITSFLLDALGSTINLAGIAYVALPEGFDAGVMRLLEAGDIRARGIYATEVGNAAILSRLAHLPAEDEALLRQKKSVRTPWRGCEALVLIESASGGSIAGVLVVGPKRIGGSLQRKDRALLVTVAHLVSTAYSNALLIQGLHVSLVQVQTSTKQLMAARKELQLLLRELVSAEERERSALARDLHDDALQEVLYVIRHAHFCTRLASELEVSWRADSASIRSEPPPSGSDIFAKVSIERLRAELTQLAGRSEVLEQKLRALCMGLYPEALRVLGLPTALEELAAQVMRTTGMDVSVYYDDTAASAAEKLSPERAVHLYRIAQETLTNVGKHAAASSCIMYLSLLATLPGRSNMTHDAARGIEWVCLTCIDDGAGLALPIDMGKLVRSGHMGLAGIRERAEQLEGRLEIRPEPTGGTRVMIAVPLVESARSRARSSEPLLLGFSSADRG
jgi:signal transduction histidine kinase